MSLPISKTIEPADLQTLSAEISAAGTSATAVYTIGGGTSLDFGLPAKRPGIGLSLKKLTSVIDYPARDMTITVQAGITMSQLRETLAAERQQLPIDVPHADRATLGGVIATNFNGPRRFGHGGVRDHVIGIEAVDGRGVVFHGGGRVVKNVAGYDFCKLLTGSCGTIGVITQVTLKVKPLPEKSSLLVCQVPSLEIAEQLLAALATSDVTPTAIELLCGSAWQASAKRIFSGAENSTSSLWLAVGLEGTAVEVEWMLQQVEKDWRARNVSALSAVHDEEASLLWSSLAEFPSLPDSPLVVKMSVVPSAVTRCVETLQQLDAGCSIQSHAGNGIVIGRLSKFPAEGLARSLVSKLQTFAAANHGSVTILSNPAGSEATLQSFWGSVKALDVMTAVKRQFDPHGILNPGRFVFAD